MIYHNYNKLFHQAENVNLESEDVKLHTVPLCSGICCESYKERLLTRCYLSASIVCLLLM